MFRLVGEDNKPIYGFTFRKELRQCNPHTSSFKDRTKRIAKELASMYNSLPLNASNAIFVCVDESRCDTLKVFSGISAFIVPRKEARLWKSV